MASPLHSLRRAAPIITNNLLVCHRCVKQTRAPISFLSNTPRRSNRLLNHEIRYSAFKRPASNASNIESTPLESLSQTIAGSEGNAFKSGSSNTSKAKSKSFPDTSSKGVAYWLLGSAASVFGIVVFGGLTRLTESG